MRGLEPPLPCENVDLNHARLPIPPHPQMGYTAILHDGLAQALLPAVSALMPTRASRGIIPAKKTCPQECGHGRQECLRHVPFSSPGQRNRHRSPYAFAALDANIAPVLMHNLS